MAERKDTDKFARLAATLGPSVAVFAAWAADSLHPDVVKLGRQLGLTRIEAEMVAWKVVRAATKEMRAATMTIELRQQAARNS